MLNPRPDNLLSGQGDAHATYARVLEEVLGEAAHGQISLRIPPVVREPLPGRLRQGVHHDPELFVQIQGFTEFITPGRRFRLMPGQVCVMPPLVPHDERASRWNGRPFANMVVMHERDHLHVHLGLASDDRLPYGTAARGYSGERLDSIRHHLNEAIAAFHDTSPGADARCQGAMLVALGHIRDSLELARAPAAFEHPKVSRCRHIATTHLSDPSLNVQELARRVGCSADYLSNLFHREVGVTLTAWLNGQRVERAKQLLRDSSMNVSEIAWATGYRDPGYLARRFRAATGRSPREYRRWQGEA